MLGVAPDEIKLPVTAARSSYHCQRFTRWTELLKAVIERVHNQEVIVVVKCDSRRRVQSVTAAFDFEDELGDVVRRGEGGW
jgi:hypothetical protein